MNKDAIYKEYEETKKLLDSLSPKLALWQETYKKLCALNEKIGFSGEEYLREKKCMHYAGEPFVTKAVPRKDKKIAKDHFRGVTKKEAAEKKLLKKEKHIRLIQKRCKEFWDKIKKSNPHLLWNKE